MPPWSPSYLANRRAMSAKRTTTRTAGARAARLAVARATPTKRSSGSGGANINKQIRALIAAKKRDALDTDRDRALFTTTASTCLTSTDQFTGAAPGIAAQCLLQADADEVMINSVRFRGYQELPASLDVNTDANRDTYIRHLVVWFYKPLLVASAGGTLPPITEVLVTDELHSLPVTAAANGGRFIVLSDRMWNMGVNTYQAITAVGAAINTGKSKQYFDYTVKVGKTVKFKESSTTNAPGGHYSSNSAPGQVDRGLLVLYSQVAIGASAQTCNTVMTSRLNYTG